MGVIGAAGGHGGLPVHLLGLTPLASHALSGPGLLHAAPEEDPAAAAAPAAEAAAVAAAPAFYMADGLAGLGLYTAQ